MDGARQSELVLRHHLAMMRCNAAGIGDDHLAAFVADGRSLDPIDVVWLLRSSWRERSVGAWWTLLHAGDAAVLDELLRSLVTSGGSLTAPALAVATVRLATRDDAVAALRVYLARDLEEGWGAAGFAIAALAHLGAAGDVPVLDDDRADLDAMLAVADRIAPVA